MLVCAKIATLLGVVGVFRGVALWLLRCSDWFSVQCCVVARSKEHNPKYLWYSRYGLWSSFNVNLKDFLCCKSDYLEMCNSDVCCSMLMLRNNCFLWVTVFHRRSGVCWHKRPSDLNMHVCWKFGTWLTLRPVRPTSPFSPVFPGSPCVREIQSPEVQHTRFPATLMDMNINTYCLFAEILQWSYIGSLRSRESHHSRLTTSSQRPRRSRASIFTRGTLQWIKHVQHWSLP